MIDRKNRNRNVVILRTNKPTSFTFFPPVYTKMCFGKTTFRVQQTNEDEGR